MKIFNDIPPNAGHQSIQQGFKAVASHAKQVLNGRTEWALFELVSDPEDSRWLQNWALNLRAEDVRFWLQPELQSNNGEEKLK